MEENHELLVGDKDIDTDSERSGSSGVRLALGALVADRSSGDREGFLGCGLGPWRAVRGQRSEACIGGEGVRQVLRRPRGIFGQWSGAVSSGQVSAA